MSQYFSFSLLNKRELAQDTWEFAFHAPGYEFTPGQYAYVTLPKTGDSDPTRIFSFVNAPGEGKLVIAARIRPESPYKQSLLNLKIGECAQFSQAIGFFSLPQDVTHPVVFIAGGIGIVPFLSHLEWESLHPSGRSITLLWSNAAPESTPYQKEVEKLIRIMPHVSLIQTFTRTTPPTWEGKTMRFGNAELARFGPFAAYYLAGTPAMVEELKELLVNLNVPLGNIHQEAFTGY